MEYSKITTSAEVWAVIHARHKKDLVVFSSFSNLSGGELGSDQYRGRMMTEYSFKDAECPLLGADTQWDTPDEEPKYKRLNEVTEYWLCVPVSEYFSPKHRMS